MNHLLPINTTTDEQNRNAKVAILPIGSFEQHGPHLPLITDTAIASILSRELSSSYPVFALPPITISCSHEHHAWAGTVSISARTLFAIIEDIYDSIARSGIESLILVNGHGGNYVLSNIVQEANAKGRRMALFPGNDDWKYARSNADLTTTMHADMHAGELETSILLHGNPELVGDGYQSADHIHDDRPHLLTLGMKPYTENGVIGRPSLGTAVKGKVILSSLVERFADTLKVVS